MDLCIAGIKNTFVEIILDIGFASDGPSSSGPRTLSTPVLAVVGSDRVTIHCDHTERLVEYVLICVVLGV